MWQLNWPWIRHKWIAAVLTLGFLPSWFGVISTLWHTILHVKAIAVQLFQECNRILPITVVMVVHHDCLWIYAQLDSAPVATWLHMSHFFFQEVFYLPSRFLFCTNLGVLKIKKEKLASAKSSNYKPKV